MIVKTIAGAFAALFILSSSIAAETDDLRQKQQAQEKARSVAAQLISGVLDIQLRQLEQNDMQHLPIYSEIKSMRRNIDQLIDREMQSVVRLLAAAQEGSDESRIQRLNEARGVIREVVVALMAERQRLQKRLQVARLSAQARRLIDMQSAVLEATRALPALGVDRREAIAFATIEDQRDVAALYLQLKAALDDVSTWSGPIATGAAEGLRVLRTTRVDGELRDADSMLVQNEFMGASQKQRTVVKGLHALLRIMEQSQGLAGANRDDALKVVRSLIERQDRLRGETRKGDLSDDTVKDQLSFRQREVQRRLVDLGDMLIDHPNTEPIVEQSREASSRAEAELFEGRTTEALLQQGQVVGGLAEIESQLLEARESLNSDKTADELSEEVRLLTILDELLDRATVEQTKATQAAADKPMEAGLSEQSVFEELDAAKRIGEFPTAVETRLDDARDAVAAANAAFQETSPESARERRKATERAEAVLQQTATIVKAQLADARRRQLAVEVGELARAAEALERAAAAQRRIADTTVAAANSQGLQEQHADALAAEQAKIDRVAEEIAEGVANTAPAVSKQLAETGLARRAIQDRLAATRSGTEAESRDAAKHAGDLSASVARELGKAAAELRKHAGETASRLTELTDTQVQPVVAARVSTEETLAEVERPRLLSRSDLERAQALVGEAQISHLRAGGKIEASQARKRFHEVAKTRDLQKSASHLAEQVELGRSRTPLDAFKQQQVVAETAAVLAAEASGELRRLLDQVAQVTGDAARETLIGNPKLARAARQESERLLMDATQLAAAEFEAALRKRPGLPDAQAQAEVSRLASDARAALREQAATTRGMLMDAERHSVSAEKAIIASNSPVSEQEQVEHSLDAASAELEKAILSHSAAEQSELAQQAETSARLARQATPLDPAATAALRQASRSAPTSEQNAPFELDRAEQSLKRGLQRAVASLAAREARLRRDKSVAEALAHLAFEQQQARDEIALQAEALEELSSEAKSPDASPSREQIDAAKALEEATRRFADAQRATGEGAVEISGQREVANQPIRRGLDAASQLGAEQQTQSGERTPEEGGEEDAATEATAPDNGGPADAAGESTDAPGAPSEPGSEQTPGEPGAGSPGDGKSQDRQLGSGFVPDSPEFTAEQIAGEEALAQAAKTLSQAIEAASPPDSDESRDAANSVSEPGPDAKETSPNSNKSSDAAQGSQAPESESKDNEQMDDAALDVRESAQGDSRTADDAQDAEALSRSFRREPWFARLPPALQNAIQARSRRRAPRGYEKRLKRYFENIDD